MKRGEIADPGAGQVAGFAISAFFNIHHYFTDGVVWKLRDPTVRADLFGHLKQ